MLKDKVIIVTGGLGLLGQAFVKAIEKNSGIAVVADIHSDSPYQLDITSKDSINDLIESVSKKYGRIDAIVNNAYPRNKNYGKHFFDVEYEDFCENMGLNLGGYFLTSQKLSEYFIKQGHGNIVNISSIYGVIPPKFEVYDNTKMTMPVEYSAIKSGLIHLTKYMAKYLKGKNIRVNTLSPGGILDQQPQEFLNSYKSHSLNKGMLDKEDLTGSLIFLLSDQSKYINGQNIIVDDGFTL
jgi:NAD(P)-dependent dehydrogenase (short-subunit alcohol dehydrogenase family)